MIKIRDIIEEEASRNKISVDCILSDTITDQVVDVRHYAMWRARKETKASFTQIGRAFNRNHTSVIYAFQKIERLCREGGILQIRPAPPTEKVGSPGVVIPLRSGTSACGILQLIQVDGKWTTYSA